MNYLGLSDVLRPGVHEIYLYYGASRQLGGAAAPKAAQTYILGRRLVVNSASVVVHSAQFKGNM